ncbi:MAG: hypothetical protein ABFE13_10950 [Phycisphaerales bacterium]
MIAGTSRQNLEFYVGRLQPQYHTDGHAQIGQMLDNCGIPFFYRQPLLICADGRRGIQRPDFALPTYNNAVIEYDPDNDTDLALAARDSIYRRNGIAALFLQPSDLAKRHWQERLYDRLEEMYRQAPWQSTTQRSGSQD